MKRIAISMAASGATPVAISMAGLVLAFTMTVAAGQPADVVEEIESRCQEQVGPYGEGMVGVCIEGDVRAIAALSDYPPEYAALIARCMNSMRPYGYAMVKTCVDEAARAGAD